MSEIRIDTIGWFRYIWCLDKMKQIGNSILNWDGRPPKLPVFVPPFSAVFSIYLFFNYSLVFTIPIVKAIIHIFCSVMFFIWCRRLMRYLSSFAASDLGLRVSQFLTLRWTCTVQRCSVTCSYTFLTALMIDFLPSHVTEATSMPRDFSICKSSFSSL